MQRVLETMATEFDEVAEAGHDEGELAHLERQVDDAVEALVTLREARNQIASIRKDRGFKGSKSADSPKKGKGGPKTGNCFDCGQSGHWAGDPKCPRARGDKTGKAKGGKSLKKTFKSLRPGTSPSADASISEANVVDLMPSRWPSRLTLRLTR